MKNLKNIIRKNLNLISESEPSWVQKFYNYFPGPFKNSTKSQPDPNSKNNKNVSVKKTKPSVNTETIEIQTMISKTKYANDLQTTKSKTGIDGYWGKRTSEALLRLLNDYENKTKNSSNLTFLDQEDDF